MILYIKSQPYECNKVIQLHWTALIAEKFCTDEKMLRISRYRWKEWPDPTIISNILRFISKAWEPFPIHFKLPSPPSLPSTLPPPPHL